MNEIVYSEPKIIHYEGCSFLSGYDCDCYSIVEETESSND
jgi:hypothetical protein